MSKGFTFIELIIVIILLGILTVSVSVKFPSLVSYNIPTQASQVAQDIRYAQSLAMSSDQKVWIYFNTSNSTYQITTGTCGSGGTLVPNPTTGTTNPQLYTGISFHTSLTGNCLAFDSQGFPYQGTSTTPITSNETVQLCPSSGCGGGGGGCSGGGGCGGPTTGCTVNIAYNTGYAYITCP
ncbi:MAG: prepilin-type N-terminal cleavage/methylation domain-containing protein [Thermodesulfobacteriota bacterium]